jgi:hypothetical protein
MTVARHRRMILCITSLAAVAALGWLRHHLTSSSVNARLLVPRVARWPSSPPPARAPITPDSSDDGSRVALRPPDPVLANDTSDPAARAIAVERIEQTLQLYRDTMVYPLSSRPADDSSAYITRWNHPISLGQTFAVDRAGREIQAVAQIDRTFAPPGVPVSVQALVTYVADGTPASVEDVGAELQWRDREANEWVTVQAVPLHRTGDSWTGSVVPSQIDALRVQMREPRILVFVRNGEYAREFPLDFAYAVAQPVIVHGLASEQAVDGSLELGLDVELTAPAPVRLVATLFAADGTTPIAVFDDRYFPTKPGRQVIPVRVFGKVLHDRGVDGPYRLGSVHGYMYRRDAMPDQLVFDRADLPAMVTAAYPAARFSPDAYQSPEIAARVTRYEALRDALRTGRTPP